jgi:DNA mismatch repair protein MutS
MKNETCADLVKSSKPTMFDQYINAQKAFPGVLMLMRVGDFYEAYGDDAELLAKTCEITLTGRSTPSGTRIPMSGVPFHSVEKYLAKCLLAGLKVALLDQTEDPKTVKDRLLNREVTKVYEGSL